MSDTQKIQAFSWSDERVLSPFELLQYFECAHNGDYYELPFSVEAHARYYYSLLYIRSALQAKANILTSCYQPHDLLPRQEFAKLAMDYLWLGEEVVRFVPYEVPPEAAAPVG